MSDRTIASFSHGTNNLLNPEIIPEDAAQDSVGWITRDGRLVLSYGRNIVGNEGTTGGKISGIWFGYKVDGSKVMYRKVSTKIQYLNVATWTDIITGLTANADYTFTNYSSLAGAFTYVGGIDGIWKIVNAFPASPINMTLASKNFCGHILIDKARMLLWGRTQDPTGLYGSHTDAQAVGTQYTAVTGESVTTSGTLVAGHGGTKNLFGLVITVTVGGEVYTDNFLGVLKGSLGGADGTINYITGAYTVRAAGTAVYSWEDSNALGVTDFSYSGTRLKGEGFILRQDTGGDAILNVLIGQDGVYYSEKSQSFYSLALDVTDLAPVNLVYRNNLGVPFYRAGIATNKGIVFMNTANPAKPEMTILQKSITTNNVEPIILFPHFRFANYDYSDCSMDTWERYVIVQCKTVGAVGNDTVLLCDLSTGIVDAIAYEGRCSATNAGNLYFGSTVTENVYQIFNGFDDVGKPVTNYWTSKADQYQMATGFARSLRYQIGERLKKYRKEKIKGTIAPSQTLQVYVDCDGSEFQLVGTILGTGDYVDYSSPQTIGSSNLGVKQIGGDDNTIVAYPYFTEIKVKLPKFRTRTIKLVVTGVGYCDVQLISDWDILVFEQRLPSRFRQKQNVSLDGTQTDLTES